MSYYGKTLGFFRTAGYDSDAYTFFTNAGITDAGEKDLWNDFVLGCKSDLIYSKIKTFHPMLGSSLTTKSYNAIDTSLSQVTWTNVSNTPVGVECDGGGYGSFSVSGLSATNSGIGVFVYDWGDIPLATIHYYVQSTVGYIALGIEKRGSEDPIIYSDSFWDENTFTSEGSGAISGLLALQSTNQATDPCRLYMGDGSGFWEGGASTTTSTISSVIFGDTNGTSSGYNTICCQFTTEGLVESEMIALKSRIYTLMNGLGRVI